MRNLIFTIICVSSFTASSQLKVGNFSYDNGKITWQKVFNTSYTPSEMRSLFKSISVIQEVIAEEESLLTIRCGFINHDFQSLGYPDIFTPAWITENHSYGTAIIQIKEGRYRVTLTNIILEDHALNVRIPIEECVLRINRNDFRNNFISKDHEILDHSYTKAFDLNNHIIVDDDF